MRVRWDRPVFPYIKSGRVVGCQSPTGNWLFVDSNNQSRTFLAVSSSSPTPPAEIWAVLSVPTKYGPNPVQQERVALHGNGGQQEPPYISAGMITSYRYGLLRVWEHYFGSRLVGLAAIARERDTGIQPLGLYYLLDSTNNQSTREISLKAGMNTTGFKLSVGMSLVLCQPTRYGGNHMSPVFGPVRGGGILEDRWSVLITTKPRSTETA